MILVTGGAGFIGSNLHAALVRRGHETVVVDRLGAGDKWRNLASHPPARLLPPEDLQRFLDLHPPVEMVFHLGAITETTATDGDLVWASNVELPLTLWHWCAQRGCGWSTPRPPRPMATARLASRTTSPPCPGCGH